VIAADFIGDLGAGAGYRIARESLTIVGWGAMWRPFGSFFTIGGRSSGRYAFT